MLHPYTYGRDLNKLRHVMCLSLPCRECQVHLADTGEAPAGNTHNCLCILLGTSCARQQAYLTVATVGCCRHCNSIAGVHRWQLPVQGHCTVHVLSFDSMLVACFGGLLCSQVRKHSFWGLCLCLNPALQDRQHPSTPLSSRSTRPHDRVFAGCCAAHVFVPDLCRLLPCPLCSRPLQQPIGDFDAQRKRLDAIRVNLRGWRALGCELIECYQ
jgi:hypothetical protein